MEVRDPLLRRIGLGPRTEPRHQELIKEDVDHERQTAAAGSTSLDDARRDGLGGWLRVLGPGLITGASDDDPSGIGTYSQVGSQFGYGLLWTALFTFPLMAAVQELCARITLETGVGLANALRSKFPTWLIGACVLLLFIANAINLGADLGAIGAGVGLLSQGHVTGVWVVAAAALILIGMQVKFTYAHIFSIFKWLTLALGAYVITVFFAHPNLGKVVLATFVPHLEPTRDFVTALVAVLGTTISPYLFFWQASSEVEQMAAAGELTRHERDGTSRREMQAARFDITVGMAFSQVVMYCIILTGAAVLNAHGKTNVQTASDAAAALTPLAGPLAGTIFAIGIIGTGLLAVPILAASASYAVKEFFHMRGSLADRFRYRPTFYSILILAMLIGVAMNVLHVNVIAALFWTAVVNGVVAVPLLVLIVLLGADRERMKARVSGRLSLVLTWAATALMGVAAVVMIAQMLPFSPLSGKH